ncbi:MAG: hypothetical protein ACTSXS_09290 [Candidatus Thorarchaeota archaeon]
MKEECELWITPDDLLATTAHLPQFAKQMAAMSTQVIRSVIKDGMCSIKYGLSFKT